MSLTRGQVYWATVGGQRKPWLVVSNDARNRALGTCLAARLTTSAKPKLASIVELDPADAPLIGRVLCDDLAELKPHADRMALLASLTPATMARVNDGLKVALALH